MNRFACFPISPRAIDVLTWERKDVGSYMIFSQDLNQLARSRRPVSDEAI